MKYDIAIVGECRNADGEMESLWLLKQMLAQVGIRFEDCFLTYVLDMNLPASNYENLAGGKPFGIPGKPAIAKGKYLNVQYAPQLDRLYADLERANPNVIIALGAASVWALLNTSGIKGTRGSATEAKFPSSRPFKVIPTYPAISVRRDFTLRPIVISDLNKVATNAAFPEIRRTSREIWLEPDLGDLLRFERQYIQPAHQLSIDIETKGDQITCIGFSPSPYTAITIPFWSARQPDGNYWRTLREELAAWNFVRRWCKMKPSLFQNGLYDAHRLWRTYGIPTTQMEDDTMLLHHALQPEMEKGLGFLGSIYSDEISWKLLRKVDTLKKED